MKASNIKAPDSNQRRRHRRRGRKGKGRHPEPYRVGELLSVYLISLAAVFLCAAIAPAFVILAFFVAGFFLTRYISERVIWWNQSNNLQNVFRTKVHTYFTWPASVPMLILKIFITQVL